jgi:hypothetical protein
VASKPHDFPLDRPANARAFDFLFGRWRVHNRRRWRPLTGDDEWEQFGGCLEVRPILGGLGNMDQFRTVLADSFYERSSLRIFSRPLATWHIYWADTDECSLSGAAVGLFDGAHGEFLGRAEYDKRPILVRFVWNVGSGNSAHWEQAFSQDDGESWETNWVMRLERE